tara:strand:- start:981 stop:1643 length:663 start_codon:yes stop_codon:yes gene_type:complete
MIKAIIFDFDGVILESVDIKKEAFIKLYSTYGKDVVQKVHNHHIENGGMSRYDKIKHYHKNFIGIDPTQTELIRFTKKFSEIVFEKVINAPYVNGALEFIQDNYKKYSLFISTATPTDEINLILKAKKISDYFIGVYGSPDIKKKHIIKIGRKFNFDLNEMIMFGDSTSDLIAAKDCSIQFVLRMYKNNVTLFKEYGGHIISDFTEREKLNLILDDLRIV